MDKHGVLREVAAVRFSFNTWGGGSQTRRPPTQSSVFWWVLGTLRAGPASPKERVQIGAPHGSVTSRRGGDLQVNLLMGAKPKGSLANDRVLAKRNLAVVLHDELQVGGVLFSQRGPRNGNQAFVEERSNRMQNQ